jgi:hypothetical protein
VPPAFAVFDRVNRCIADLVSGHDFAYSARVGANGQHLIVDLEVVPKQRINVKVGLA